MNTTDEDTVRSLLQGTASDESSSVDPQSVVDRGERGLRRRRWITVGAAGTAVAVVALSASVLPGLDRNPEPAGGGEDRALRLLMPAEAAQRCRTQWSAIAGRDVGPVRLVGKSTEHETMNRPTLLTAQELEPFEKARQDDFKRTGIGPKPIDYFGRWPGTAEPVVDRQGRRYLCVVPGNWTPSASDLATDEAGKSIPDDDSSLLRRCSTIFWHDFSRWRVQARQVEPGVAATLVATSPGGQLVVHCVVTDRSLRAGAYDTSPSHPRPFWSPSITSAVTEVSVTTRKPHEGDSNLGAFLLGGGQWACDRPPCTGWLFHASGHLSQNITKLVATTPQGRRVEIPVHNGWFATSFAHRDPAEKGKAVRGTLAAYDASGKVIENDEYTSWSGIRR